MSMASSQVKEALKQEAAKEPEAKVKSDFSALHSSLPEPTQVRKSSDILVDQKPLRHSIDFLLDSTKGAEGAEPLAESHPDLLNLAQYIMADSPKDSPRDGIPSNEISAKDPTPTEKVDSSESIVKEPISKEEAAEKDEPVTLLRSSNSTL